MLRYVMLHYAMLCYCTLCFPFGLPFGIPFGFHFGFPSGSLLFLVRVTLEILLFVAGKYFRHLLETLQVPGKDSSYLEYFKTFGKLFSPATCNLSSTGGGGK